MRKSTALALAACTFFLNGCNKTSQTTTKGDPATPIDLGVIELSPNIPKHVNVGDGKDWTITETILADGRRQVMAEADSKVTAEQTNDADWHKSGIPPGTPVGTPIQQKQDMSGLPTGVVITGYIGNQLTHYTLKYNAS